MAMVRGFGFNDRTRPTTIKNKMTREYTLWLNMLDRCYSDKTHERYPKYKNCYMSADFLNYSYFYEWCQDQIGFKNKGWELDKDLLVKGNLIYSQDTCVFVPREINILLSSSKEKENGLPIGVGFHKFSGKFICRVGDGVGSKSKHLGFFDNPEDAFNKYKKHKKERIVYVAEKYKSEIRYDVYSSLINYNFID